MQFTFKNSLVKRVSIALEVAVAAALLAWISKTYIAGMWARKSTLRKLELAVRLDPGDSDYHLQLGRLFEYAVPELDTERGIQHLRRAADLNPYDPQAWLDLGAALEFQGKTREAEACLRRAGYLAPNLPAFHWVIGNFFLLHGNVDEAFKHFKTVLAGSSQYNHILFSIAWRATGDGERILRELIPNNLSTEFDYLYYVLAQNQYSDARSVWTRIANSSESFQAPQASGYLDALIAAHRLDEADQVWNDLRRKGLVENAQANPGQNLVLNGDFEGNLSKVGFDWRIIPFEGFYASLDDTTYHSPTHALLIQFSGKRNLDYRLVWQFVRVTPKRSYELRAFAKTESITTDSGPCLEIRDAYEPGRLDKFSESLTESTTGWNALTVDFTAGPKTDLIVVAVARRASRKIDSLIAGKVWVDDLRLVPAPEQKTAH